LRIHLSILIYKSETLEARNFETKLELYLKQTNTVLISGNQYGEEVRERNEAVDDREILGDVLMERQQTMSQYEKEEQEWREKIRILEEKRSESKQDKERLQKKRKRIQEEERMLEELIKKANKSVE
jgi:hypothetical protein